MLNDSDIRLAKSTPEIAKQVPDPRRAPDVRVNGKLIDTKSEFAAKPTAAGGF